MFLTFVIPPLNIGERIRIKPSSSVSFVPNNRLVCSRAVEFAGTTGLGITHRRASNGIPSREVAQEGFEGRDACAEDTDVKFNGGPKADVVFIVYKN